MRERERERRSHNYDVERDFYVVELTENLPFDEELTLGIR
jgi:hypothetical protein